MYVNISIMGDINLLKKDELAALLKEVSSPDKLEKESAISWDSRNLVIRIPKEIAEVLNINEKNRFKKSFKFVIEEKNGEKVQSFIITERSKPRKKVKNE